MSAEGTVFSVLWCGVGAAAVTYCELCYWGCRRRPASWSSLAYDVRFWPVAVANCWAGHTGRTCRAAPP